LELVLAVKRDELHRGARPELHALMDVPGVSLWVARALYDAGLHSPEMLMKLDTTSTVGWGVHVLLFFVGCCGGAMRTGVAADAPGVITLRCTPQRVYEALVKVVFVSRKRGGQPETTLQTQRRKEKEKAESCQRASRTTKSLLCSCRKHVQAAAKARAAELAAERAAVPADVDPSAPPADPPPHTHSAPFTP